MPVTDDIKARLDIVSYIQRFVPGLKKSGKNYKALCPFHNEKTPSFVVNPTTQTWRCYGACADGGDLFSFYERRHNVEFKDALKALADEAGVELPQYNKKQLSDKQQSQLDILSDLATRYHNLLTDYEGADQVRAYLESRGISSESIQQWQLGYAPKTNIAPKLVQKYSAPDLLDLGIIYKNDHGQLRSRFYNRLMIPIHNPAGQVVGFGARKLDDGNTAKYINSHESTMFHKSHLLYGWHIARKQAQWQSQIVIVEGYMDVIQAHQSGYANVTAQMGTAMTEEQVSLIGNTNIDTIIMCLDGDNAGKEAAQRAIDNLIAHVGKKDIRIVQLPDGQDPDTIIQSGQWEQVVSSAVPVIDYVIDTAVANLPTNPSLGQKHQIADEVIPKLYMLDDKSKLWSIQQLASAIGLHPMSLVDYAHNLMSNKIQSTQSPEPAETIQNNSVEGYIVRCLLEYHNDYYYQLVAKFSALQVDMLSRADFEQYDALYQQIIDIIDTPDDTLPLDHLDIDPDTLSSDPPNLTDFLLNCLYLRLNHTQRTLDELLELQNFAQFSHVLTQREQLTQVIAQMS